MIRNHKERIKNYRERASRLRRDMRLYLEELKHSDPVKYQELVEAEESIYRSWLESFHPEYKSRGILHCNVHGGHGFSSDCLDCKDR